MRVSIAWECMEQGCREHSQLAQWHTNRQSIYYSIQLAWVSSLDIGNIMFSRHRKTSQDSNAQMAAGARTSFSGDMDDHHSAADDRSSSKASKRRTFLGINFGGKSNKDKDVSGLVFCVSCGGSDEMPGNQPSSHCDSR